MRQVDLYILDCRQTQFINRFSSHAPRRTLLVGIMLLLLVCRCVACQQRGQIYWLERVKRSTPSNVKCVSFALGRVEAAIYYKATGIDQMDTRWNDTRRGLNSFANMQWVKRKDFYFLIWILIIFVNIRWIWLYNNFIRFTYCKNEIPYAMFCYCYSI